MDQPEIHRQSGCNQLKAILCLPVPKYHIFALKQGCHTQDCSYIKIKSKVSSAIALRPKIFLQPRVGDYRRKWDVWNRIHYALCTYEAHLPRYKSCSWRACRFENWGYCTVMLYLLGLCEGDMTCELPRYELQAYSEELYKVKTSVKGGHIL